MVRKGHLPEIIMFTLAALLIIAVLAGVIGAAISDNNSAVAEWHEPVGVRIVPEGQTTMYVRVGDIMIPSTTTTPAKYQVRWMVTRENGERGIAYANVTEYDFFTKWEPKFAGGGE